MVPDKFDMVDMGGIDLIESQGVVVDGLYNRLVESIALCRYQCLYNWKFDGIIIPPSYVEMEVRADGVWINEGVMVDENDVIYITGEEPPTPVEPVIESISVTQNGTYTAPTGVDGYNPVTVNVPPVEPVIESISVTQNGTYTAPTGVDGYNPVTVNVPSGAQVSPNPPSPEYGNVGDFYIQETYSEDLLFGITITKAGRDTNKNFNYWGAKEVRLVFEDNQGNLVYFRDLASASCEVAVGNTGAFNNQPELIDGNTGNYVEKSGLPGFIRLYAKVPSNLNLVRLDVWSRSDTYWKDYWVDFKLAQWSANREQVGQDILSETNLNYSDWAFGNYTEFPISFDLYRPIVPYIYKKTQSGWVLLK